MIHICWPSRLPDLWNPRGLDRAGRPVVCQWCIEDFAKGSVVFPPCITLRITQGHGPDRCSSPGCPLLLYARCDLLPLVWQGGPKWRDHGQPLAKMHYKLGLICNKCLHFPGITSEAIQHHSQGCRQPKQKWYQRGRWGPQWHIYIRLTNPNHSLQPKHYPPRWQCNASTSRQSHCRTLILFQDSYNFSLLFLPFIMNILTFCNKNNFKMLNSHPCSLPCTT